MRRHYASWRTLLRTVGTAFTIAEFPALLSLEDRPKLLTKLRSIGVAVNVGSMHGGSTNDLFFLPADRESTTGLTWHVSTINTLAWHPYLLYWHADYYGSAPPKILGRVNVRADT